MVTGVGSLGSVGSVLRRGWVGRLVLAVAVAGGLAACDIAPIEGPRPLRYRDELFAQVAKTENITYGTAVRQDGTTATLLADVYRPVGDTVTSRPLVVLVHGGGFSGGTKTSGEIVDQANFYAKKGYVTASISYRLTPGGCGQPDAECIDAIIDAREDAQAAVRFFRANAATYGIDTTRVGIGGTSAGAITALQVGYVEADAASEVDAAVSLSGAVIFTGEVGPGDAPSLLFHGTTDGLVPYSWATATVDAARQDGLPSTLVTWEGDGHVPYTNHRSEILTYTTHFLYRRLDAANAAR